ncbi:MAG: response regulator transcription factor [Bacteroidetes bacterium]|nr:response regulator transcription factor [Bacteroidota bacterium]
MLRTLIIDDEEHIRDTLAKMLARYCPQVEVVGNADSLAKGVKAIEKYNPELVLLDVQLADGNGFDLLKSLPAIRFQVIFITAYDKYALGAFKFSAIDYLLKPINPEQLANAVERAQLVINEHLQIQIHALEENLRSGSRQDRRIILKTLDNIYLIELRNIVCCESDSCYTTLHTTTGDRIVMAKTLKDYEELFAGSGFYRVHKSYLINLSHIKRFEKQDGGYIVLLNELKIPVASRRREEIIELMEKMAE